MRTGSAWEGVAVLLWLAASFSCGAAADGQALGEADIGVVPDMTTEGRWGAPEKDGDRTFRQYPGKMSLSYVGIKAWWSGERAPEDSVLAITCRDAGEGAVQVYGWTGDGELYGYARLGQIAERRDGAWKRVLIWAPKSAVRRHPDGDWKGNWSLLFSGPVPLAVDRIEFLAATAENRAAAARQAAADRTAAIEAICRQWPQVPWKETTALGDVNAEDTKRGFIPFARNYARDVYPGTVPAAAERGARTIKTYATLGEFEPVQVAAYALADATLLASVTDLKGPGTLAAGRDVVIRYVECVPLRAGGGSGVKSWQVQPAWLRGNKPLAVKAHGSQAWYVTLHVPADAKPGDYRGTVTIAAANGGKAEFPLELKVLPVALDRADQFARGPYVSGQMEEDDVRVLREYGVNSCSMWHGGGLAPRKEADACTAVVTPAMDDYLRRLKKAGFVRMVYFGGGDNRFANPAGVADATASKVGTPEFAKYYGEYWTAIRRLEKQNGWPKMICCPFDEPVKSDDRIRNYLACYDAVKKASPDTQVFCVFMNRPTAAERLGLTADIWSCNGAFDVNAARKKALEAEGVHRLLYPYTGCTVRSKPGATRWSAGFCPWKYGADGIYFWAYLWSSEDPFNDLDGDVSDWTPAARDVDDVIYTCVGFEGWREGIDDRLYVETALRLAKERNRKDVLDKLAELQASLVPPEESEQSRKTGGLDGFFMNIADTDLLDTYRARVVMLLMDLLGESKR